MLNKSKISKFLFSVDYPSRKMTEQDTFDRLKRSPVEVLEDKLGFKAFTFSRAVKRIVDYDLNPKKHPPPVLTKEHLNVVFESDFQGSTWTASEYYDHVYASLKHEADLEKKQRRLFILYVVLFILLSVVTSVHVVAVLVTNKIAILAASILNGLFFGYCITSVRERIILEHLRRH